MTTLRIGFVGGGKMAEAILAALVRSETVAADQVLVSDVSGERRELLAHNYGVRTTADNGDVLAEPGVIVLAVKPQQLDDVLQGMAAGVREAHLLLSIAAGKRLAYFEQRLPAGRIVRVMPNIAALVGSSMNVFCVGARGQAGDRETVVQLLSSFGQALELPEALFDAVTALSGSGPAFIAQWVEAAVQGGVSLGLKEAAARTLAYQTLLGTARLLVEGRFTPETLTQAVSSAKGTTVAGLAVLSQSSLAEDLRRTLAAAAERSRELSV